ncbi:MAG: choice-of-anchor B family protein [Bacteroidota bacterium]|jgi:choice-of-anchor B domain-containing protein
MRYVHFIALFLFCSLIRAQGSKNISLLDRWNSDTLITNSSQVRYSGCWGFERNGIEYAIVGSTEGSHFFKITNKNKLEPVDFVEGRFVSTMVIHREFKTYGNYAYAICDEGTSSLQIIDLSYLPDSVVKVADLQDERFGKVHNLFIDSANALLYACLVTPFSGGTAQSIIPLRVFSLTNPVDPQLVWEGPSDIPEVHDCYVRNNIALLNCGMDGLRVYDFTEPSSPVYKSNLTFYQDQGYNHQGWLSPDGKTYVFADETNGKKIKKCKVNEDHSIQVQVSFGTQWEKGSIPHNIMCTNDFAFVAYYNEGLRIFDLRYGTPRELAFYDTYPEENIFKMNGAWGVYSNFPSGRVIVSDRQYGLFLFDFNRNLFSDLPDREEFTVYPNPVPSGSDLIIRAPKDELSQFELELTDFQGKILLKKNVQGQSYCQVKMTYPAGVYFIRVRFENYLSETVFETLKVIIHN